MGGRWRPGRGLRARRAEARDASLRLEIEVTMVVAAAGAQSAAVVPSVGEQAKKSSASHPFH